MLYRFANFLFSFHPNISFIARRYYIAPLYDEYKDNQSVGWVISLSVIFVV